MAFNPKDHVLDLKGKEYLPVAARMAWFREKFPSGAITTDFVSVGEMIIARAFIATEGGVIASGSATVRAASGRETWAGRDVEKAETAAIGRALAAAGFGTMQTGEEFEEGEYLADSPRERKQAASWATVDTVEQFITNAVDKLQLRRSEIQELLQFNLDRLDIWNALYADRGAAGADLKERFSAAVPESTAPNYDKQAVYETVKDLYRGVFPHFTASLTKLAAEGKIVASMTTEEVVNVIKAHKAVQA